MKLGTQVGLGPGHIVLDGDTAPPPPKRHSPLQFSTYIRCGQYTASPNFRPMFIVPKRLDASRCHLVWRQASAQGTLCSMGTQPPLPKKGASKRGLSPLPNFRPLSIVAKRLDETRWHLAWRWAMAKATLSKMGNQLPSPEKGAEPHPQFSAHFYSARNTRIASAVLVTAIPSVCLSVCLSVTRRYCVKTAARSTVQFAPLDSKMCLVL